RRVRPRRGSFRSDRSLEHQPGRGDPRPGDLALRLAGDRRRRLFRYSDNKRIPDKLPCRDGGTARAPGAIVTKAPVAPQQDGCVSVETRGSATTVDNGINGGLLLDAGKGNFAFHADVFGRKADDYRVPKYPYLVPPDPVTAPRATQPDQFHGKQPNSA